MREENGSVGVVDKEEVEEAGGKVGKWMDGKLAAFFSLPSRSCTRRRSLPSRSNQLQPYRKESYKGLL